MAPRDINSDVYEENVTHTPQMHPFESVEEVWFWFIQAQEARNEGARFSAGAGVIPRPCEPLDILKILDGLYRQRRLLRDHLLVLRYYGRRQFAPDPNRVKEARSFTIWKEALGRMETVLVRKGIIRKRNEFQFEKGVTAKGVTAK